MPPEVRHRQTKTPAFGSASDAVISDINEPEGAAEVPDLMASTCNGHCLSQSLGDIYCDTNPATEADADRRRSRV